MRGDDTDGGDESDSDPGRTDRDTRRVIAQGTFDLLHPGHLHYLEEAAEYGDELHVIVAREQNVTHKPRPICPERQRRDLVAALEVVDQAHLGHPEDIFVPVERIDPAVIVLGFDQHHDVSGIREALANRGIDARVVRASGRDPRYDGEMLSTGAIVKRILEERG